MTSKEAMKIIEQRHLTTPEAYEVVHALFEAERREAALEKLCDDATQLDGERECWLSERSVRDVLSPPSSWPTNEAESEALRQERGMAQVRESASPPPAEPGLRELLKDAMQLLHGVGMWKHQDIEDQWRMSYKEVAERYAALARTPPQKPQGDAL